MKKDYFIRISKVKPLNNEYSDIEAGYWAEGSLYEDICVGRPIFMSRIKNSRHPEDERLGYFESTPVQSIVGNIAYTSNNAYKIENL